MFEKGPVRDEFATVEWIMSSSEKKTCLEVLVAGFASSSWGAEARERLFVSLDFPVMLLSHRLEQKLTTAGNICLTSSDQFVHGLLPP